MKWFVYLWSFLSQSARCFGVTKTFVFSSSFCQFSACCPKCTSSWTCTMPSIVSNISMRLKPWNNFSQELIHFLLWDGVCGWFCIILTSKFSDHDWFVVFFGYILNQSLESSSIWGSIMMYGNIVDLRLTWMIQKLIKPRIIIIRVLSSSWTRNCSIFPFNLRPGCSCILRRCIGGWFFIIWLIET